MARKFTNRIRGNWADLMTKAKTIFTSTKTRCLIKKNPSPQATTTCIQGHNAIYTLPNVPIDFSSVTYREIAGTQTSHPNLPFREASVCSARSTAAMYTSEKEHREESVFEECMYCSGDEDSDGGSTFATPS
ncbi:hypothetical protein CT0861_06464 [Colletotrichum tofieldiae]|uniref:Uncharacterized protein n=1 Tax=Colletotrichum tofieldiae TaxID=708197 RepID=A0A166YF41_9PEZI|nr:hypothetical protein CT0861_06464 [Colletotrichum tofieldiae]